MLARTHFRNTVLIALALTLAQIGIGMLADQEQNSMLGAYSSLYQWDSEHYEDIATQGYFSDIKRTDNLDVMASGSVTKKTNVAFFPGYPVAARWLHAVTRLPMRVALLVTAQIFAVAFWIYFLLLLDLFRVPRLLKLLSVTLMFAHPASFFLIAGYSESLFLTMVLGYIYWSNRETANARMIAATHGFTMALTRIHGVFASAYPLLRHFALRKNTRGHLRSALLITAATILGLVGFFVFCEIAFGHWDLYLQRQRHGWGITPRYGFPFQGYLPSIPMTNSQGWMHPNNISGTLTTLTLCAFAFAGVLEWILQKKTTDTQGWRARLPIWITAFLLWYFYAASLANVEMRSMVRYLLAPHVLMILAFAHLFARLPKPSAKTRGIACALCVGVIAGCAILAWSYVRIFTSGNWVA